MITKVQLDNLYKIMELREYHVPPSVPGIERLTPLECSESQKEKGYALFFSHKNKSKALFVYCHDPQYKFGISEFRNCYLIAKQMQAQGALGTKVTMFLIIDKINSNDITSIIKNVESSEGLIIEKWQYSELDFDPSNHELVPKHELCKKQEKRKLMDQYGPAKQHPIIRTFDPQAKRLGARPGDLIKIYRPSTTMHGETIISYRYVK